MEGRGTLEVLARALGVVARHETILASAAFAELAELLRSSTGFFHLAITRSERPGLFRVLASTRGEMESLLPFRTLLTSSRRIYETVYVSASSLIVGELDKSATELERQGAKIGFGSYAMFPVLEAPGGNVIAALVVAFREPNAVQTFDVALFTEIAASIGPSVARGLLAGQRERALRIIEASGDALIAWDSEGRVTDVNRSAERLLVATRSELLGVPIQELFGAIPIGPSTGQRLPLKTRNGRLLQVAATVSPVQGDPLVFAHALVRDLSDIIAAEQDAASRLAQLRELTEQHMVLLDNAPLLIFRLDPESHEVLYLNRHAEHLFGVPASRALSTPGFLRDAHVDPEGAIAFEEAVIVAKLGQVMPAYEARLRREGGEPIIARGTIYPILSDLGRVVGIEGILLDVTSERAVRSRLLQADRLATVGMLAAGVAHEINNPAAFMLLGLDVLARTLLGQQVKMNAETEEQVRQLVADLRDTGRRIVDIARDMRTFASPPPRGDRGRTLVDVGRTIESALTITRAQIVEKADTDLELSTDLPLVAMDDGRLGQVMVNLLVNAAQAVSEARSARGPLPGGDKVRIATRVEEDFVVIEVEDTGIGIKRDVIDRVFVPFFTTKMPDVGTGLGLAISRTIIESAGGTIAVESPGRYGDPPCGARFVIRLPAHVPEDDGPESGAPVDDTPRRRGSVLIVEDEVLLGKALADQLSEMHEVSLVTSAEDALGRIARQRFDAVLCDVKMPAMSGEELYRAVASRDPEQARRFIFMTGVGFSPELQSFLAEVGAPMLEKPFPLRRALGIIAQHVAKTAD
ncbi:MAG: response regulator [Polyangiaceae bacterium]|nr:response regulator [Polyangiaceae bacterium]